MLTLILSKTNVNLSMLKLLFVVVDGRTKNTEQENDVGNDRGCNSVAPRLRFLFFLSSLNFFNF